MTAAFTSLATICLVALLAPLLAQLIPGKPFPETVFLIAIGAVIGPYTLGWIEIGSEVNMLMELGLAFLFLMAGYEIEPELLVGKRGRVAMVTWVVSFVIGLIVVLILPGASFNTPAGFVLAIAVTSTAIGTLMPILKERVHDRGPVGDSVFAHGMVGEMFPIIAIALLLSSRSFAETLGVLLIFGAITLIFAFLPKYAEQAGAAVWNFLTDKAESTSQTMVRFTMVVLTGLVAAASLLQLDIVLGAFASGFILRFVFPEGNYNLEKKIEGVSYGFFIPIFFVVSGANINLAGVTHQPVLLIGFIVTLILARAVPVFVSTFALPEDRENLNFNDRLTISLYATTALPIIVAVTTVATRSGLIGEISASIMVTAGAITVLIMPALTSITSSVAASRPIEAASEVMADPRHIREILRDHREQTRKRALKQIGTRSRDPEKSSNAYKDAQAPSTNVGTSTSSTGSINTGPNKPAQPNPSDRDRIDRAVEKNGDSSQSK